MNNSFSLFSVTNPDDNIIVFQYINSNEPDIYFLECPDNTNGICKYFLNASLLLNIDYYLIENTLHSLLNYNYNSLEVIHQLHCDNIYDLYINNLESVRMRYPFLYSKNYLIDGIYSIRQNRIYIRNKQLLTLLYKIT
jgi:hypothetical protein